jgi:DNA-binding NtrC family response regulator
VTVNVRIVASTNRVVEEALEAGLLREDLFYRLNVFQIRMPALRERKSDLPLLAEALISDLNQRHDCRVAGVDDDAMGMFQCYHWPGNVRQLRNVLERAVIMVQNGLITPRHIPNLVGADKRRKSPSADEPCVRLALGTTIPEAERALIHLTLSHTGNDKPRAAQILGISRKTMFNRLRQYRLAAAARAGDSSQ